jgi:hypothetical protein
MMDSCHKITKQASEYIDSNMPFSQRMKMRMHLLMCKHCRNFVSQLELTVGTIKNLGCKKELSDQELEKQVKTLMEKKEDKD